VALMPVRYLGLERMKAWPPAASRWPPAV